jgi:S1-C subfamily serine protease
MAEQPAKKSWVEAAKDATVAIGTVRTAAIQTKQGEVTKPIFAVVGTGVILAAPGQSQGAIPWLVTAKHVLCDPAQGWDPQSIQIRFNWFDDKPVDEYLGVELKLKNGGQRIWYEHPDPSVDLAAVPLAISPSDAGRSLVDPIPLEIFASPSDLFEGASIMAFGYPGAVGPAFWTKAVLRTGIIAWTSPKDPLKSPFLIDALVFPGNSGGPVFKVPTGVDQYGNLSGGGKVTFLGIVSQGRKEVSPLYAGGKAIEMLGPQGSIKLVTEQWVGVGVVEPASRVRELLDSAYKIISGKK